MAMNVAIAPAAREHTASQAYPTRLGEARLQISVIWDCLSLMALLREIRDLHWFISRHPAQSACPVNYTLHECTNDFAGEHISIVSKLSYREIYNAMRIQ